MCYAIHPGCNIINIYFVLTLLINKYEFTFRASSVSVAVGRRGYAVRCWIHLCSVGALNYPFDDRCRTKGGLGGGVEKRNEARRSNSPSPSPSCSKSTQSSFGLHLITRRFAPISPQSPSPIYRHRRSFSGASSRRCAFLRLLFAAFLHQH